MPSLKIILAITKKELKSFFDHPTAYILLVIFCAINSFFYFRTIFTYNVAVLRPMFDVFIWIFLLLVPAVTMKMVAEEKRSHTIETLSTQPIKERDILIGKFLGSVIFIFIGALTTLAIPILLNLYGQFDWGIVFTQYFGSFLLIAAMSSIGIFASSITKSQISAFLMSLALLFFFIISGYETVLSSLPLFFKTIAEQLSLSWHFSNVIRGVIDLRDIIYFLTITASFLFVSYWLMIKDWINPKRKIWRQLKIGLILFVVLAVIINLLGLNIHGRIDLTKNKIYTLSSATNNIIGRLSDLLTITLYTSPELPPQVSITARDVKDLLTDYESQSKGKIKINYQTVETNQASEVEAEGISPVQFNVSKADELAVKKGYFGLKVQYLDKKEVIPFIEQSNDFEYRLTSLIKKVSIANKAKVAFLSGHMEKDLSTSDYSSFINELEKQFNIENLIFNADKKEYPSKPDALIIAGPNGKMSDEEKKALSEYLNNNGKALFLIDALNINLQTISLAENPNSLSDLVEKYGVKIEKTVVGDIRSNENVTFSGEQTNYVLPYPFWIKALAQKENPITNNLASVSLPWTSSLSLTNSKTKGEELLATSESGFSENNNYNVYPDQDYSNYLNGAGKKAVAYAINLTASADNAASGRFVVVGNSNFLNNDFVQSHPENLVFAENAVDWLLQDNDLIAVRSKQRDSAPLVFTAANQKNVIKYINLLGLPVLVILIGASHLYFRRKKTKREY